MKLLSIISAMLFCSVTSTLHAQTNSQPTPWLKTTTRLVSWSEPEEDKSLATKQDKTTERLTVQLVNAIETQMAAYDVNDYAFAKPLSKSEKAAIFRERTDTILVYDPVLGEEIRQVTKVPFAQWDIKHFKLVENWQTVPGSGKSTVQTIGIVPMLDVYEDGGMFMGRKPLVLLKYNDILPILREYEQYHPEHSPFVKFWNGQFDKEEKQAMEENTSKNDKQPAK